MNKNFLEHYMKTKPETDEQKYIFLVDNQDLAFSLIGAGFLTVALLPAKTDIIVLRVSQHIWKKLLMLELTKWITAM